MTTVIVEIPAETVQYAISAADCIAMLTPLGYKITAPGAPPVTLTPKQKLAAYLKTLGANRAGVVAAQTCDLYSKTPLDALDTTPGVSLPSVTVNKPGPQTNLTPGMLDYFADPNQPAGDIEPNNPPPNDTVSLANASIAAKILFRVNGNPANPAGAGKNPWPDVLTAGSAIQNAYLATLAKDAAMFKKINGPFIYDFMGEMNLPGGLGAGNNWASAGTCTSAQFAALWVLTWNFFEAQGLNDQIFYSYETNDGAGNNLFGYPGDQYVDGFGVHTWSPFQSTETAYNALLAIANGRPICFGSCGLTWESSGVPDFAHNNFTEVCNVITAKYPEIYAAVFWNMGGNALSQQNGAIQCLSTPPWLNRSTMPAGGFSSSN